MFLWCVVFQETRSSTYVLPVTTAMVWRGATAEGGPRSVRPTHTGPLQGLGPGATATPVLLVLTVTPQVSYAHNTHNSITKMLLDLCTVFGNPQESPHDIVKGTLFYQQV